MLFHFPPFSAFIPNIYLLCFILLASYLIYLYSFLCLNFCGLIFPNFSIFGKKFSDTFVKEFEQRSLHLLLVITRFGSRQLPVCEWWKVERKKRISDTFLNVIPARLGCAKEAVLNSFLHLLPSFFSFPFFCIMDQLVSVSCRISTNRSSVNSLCSNLLFWCF